MKTILLQNLQKKRLEWIDWMKTIGIYLVILGHFQSIGEKMIYIFHVPLFYFISGILCKKESCQIIFWNKIWYNLMIPMLIMIVINFIYANIQHFINGSFETETFYWFIHNVLLGMVSSYGNLWFVFTLIILKIFFQYCPTKFIFYIQVMLVLVLAYILNNYNLTINLSILNAPNAIINVLTAYPFFAFGVLLHDYMSTVDKWKSKPILVSAFLWGLFLIIMSNHFNNYVAMYRCYYGGNMWWFLVGGFAGCMMIYAASRLLIHASKPVNIISRGTIIILGFHLFFIDLIKVFIYASYFDIIFAAVILILFIPMILITESFFPLLAGKYRTNKQQESSARQRN